MDTNDKDKQRKTITKTPSQKLRDELEKRRNTSLILSGNWEWKTNILGYNRNENNVPESN